MARIRTIKPEFPQSESMGRVSRDARLLFVQLWTICDDSGRTRANSRMLASLLYPYDDDAKGLMDGWLAELETISAIRRYEVEGDTYLDIPKWLKHQKIDKPSGAKHPGFDEGSPKAREASCGDQGREGIKEGIKDQGSTSASATPKRKAVKTVSRGTGDEDPEWFLDFKLAYPERAGDQAWRKAMRAANARMSEGHHPMEFVTGAERYAKFCAATKKLGTEFVKQAASFLGPDKPFTLPWTVPAQPETATEEIQRLNGGSRREPGRVFEAEPSRTGLVPIFGNVRG